RVVARDDGGLDASRATTNFLEFRDRIKPSAIGGFTVSGPANAVVPLAVEAKLPLLVISPTTDMLKQPLAYGADMLFASDAQIEVGYVKALAGATKPKIAIFGADSAAGRELIDVATQLVKAEGWEVVATEILPVPEPDDISGAASRVAQAQADYVIG